MLLVLAASLAVLIFPIQGARILALEPFPTKSHMIVFSSLTRELARRGHELVVVSAFPMAKPMANYTEVDVSVAQGEQRARLQTEELYHLNRLSVLQQAVALWGMGVEATGSFLRLPEIRQLLQDSRGFDLVISEAFLNEPVYAFAHHFKAPLVVVCPFGGFRTLNHYQSNPAPVTYVPNSILPYSDTMSFKERLVNSLVSAMWSLGHNLYYLPRQDAIRQEIFGSDSPSVWDLERSASLVLLNTHLSLNFPRPLVPAMVEVGGMHVQATSDTPLPKDLQRFMDQAEHGVIYFSMGSTLRSDHMPPHKLAAFLSVFSQLTKYRVVMKWESEEGLYQTPNVMFRQWLPQQDILAHPKVRLLITHGGLLSLQEAVFHGVPVVGIPMFGDQSLNMRKAELAGFGVTLSWRNVTKESLLWALGTVLHNPRYGEEAKRRSAIFRDQPQSPLERAVFYTEYVLRHKGAPHLRTASVRPAQLYMLDVMAALVATLLLAGIALRAALKACSKKESKRVVTKCASKRKIK